MSFPVRLEEYFFPVQSVKANSKHAADEDGTVQTQILRNVKKISDDEHVFSVELIIHILQKECSNAPYFINLSVYGVFKVDVEKLDNTQINALVESTGVSVLYGAFQVKIKSTQNRQC